MNGRNIERANGEPTETDALLGTPPVDAMDSNDDRTVCIWIFANGGSDAFQSQYANSLLVVCLADLVLSTGLSVLYILLYPNRLILPPVEVSDIASLDMALLAVIRCTTIFVFLTGRFTCALVFRLPLLSAFVSSLYLFLRAASAATPLALAILTVQFIACWSELLIYVHAIIIHGDQSWKSYYNNVSTTATSFTTSSSIGSSGARTLDTSILSDSNVDCVLPHLHTPANAEELIFPESPSYSIDNLKSALLQKINSYDKFEFGFQALSDRQTRLEEASLLLWQDEFDKAIEIVEQDKKHEILPRFSLFALQVRVIQFVKYKTPESLEQLRKAITNVHSTSLRLSNLSDNELVKLFLSKQPTPPHNSDFGPHSSAVLDSEPPFLVETDANHVLQDPERILWKLFRLTNDCCVAHALFFRAILHVKEGRDIKCALNLRKSWQIFEKISADLVNIPDNDEMVNTHLVNSIILIKQELNRINQLGVLMFNVASLNLSPSFITFLKAVGLLVDLKSAFDKLHQKATEDTFYSPLFGCTYLAGVALVPVGFTTLPCPYFSNSSVMEVIQKQQRSNPKFSMLHLFSGLACKNLGELDRASYYFRKCIEMHGESSKQALWPMAEMGLTVALLHDWRQAFTILHTVWESGGSSDPLVGLYVVCISISIPEVGSLKGEKTDLLRDCLDKFKARQPTEINKSAWHPYIEMLEWVIGEDEIHPFLLIIVMYINRDISRTSRSDNAHIIKAMQSQLESLYFKASHHENESKADVDRKKQKLSVLYHTLMGSLLKYQAFIGKREQDAELSRQHLMDCVSISDHPSLVVSSSQNVFTKRLISWACFELAELDYSFFQQYSKARAYIVSLIKDGVIKESDHHVTSDANAQFIASSHARRTSFGYGSRSALSQSPKSLNGSFSPHAMGSWIESIHEKSALSNSSATESPTPMVQPSDVVFRRVCECALKQMQS